MRKISFGKRIVSAALSALISLCALTGCQSEFVNDYLEEIGLRDPLVYGDGEENSEASGEISEIKIDWEAVQIESGEGKSAGGTDSAAGSAGTVPGKDFEGTDAAAATDTDFSDGSAAATTKGTDSTSANTASTAPDTDSTVVSTDINPGEDSSVGASDSSQGTGTPVGDYEAATESTDSSATLNSAQGSGQTAGDEKPSSSNPKSDEELLAARKNIGLTEEGIAAKKKQQEGLYAYEHLTDAGKTLYVEILIAMENLAGDVLVSTTSDEAIEQVFDYVMADHPEIFYVDGYHYTNYSVKNVVTKITFTGNYIYDAKEIAKRQTQINDAVNRCLLNAPTSGDEYYAIKYVYDYLIQNTVHEPEAPDNQNICSVFINGRSVCNGYSKAAQYLLGKMGIKSTIVTGYVTTRTSGNTRHAWNLVQCNNAYYYMDVTWGDATYDTAAGIMADTNKLPDINYDYLNVTSEVLLKNHVVSDKIPMPVCNSLQDNYYVREDEYFTSPELSLVQELFDRRYRDGSNNVTIKCATSLVYDKLFEELITNRKVFEYMQGDKAQISYTTFQDTGTIMFWI